MEKNFARNLINEINQGSEDELSSKFRLKELEEFKAICKASSNSQMMKIARLLFSYDVNFRSMYRLVPMCNKEVYCIDMALSRVSSPHISSLKENEVFVFGSNVQGMHGSGAAYVAMQWGAVWGQGVGLAGQTYAIPTIGDSLDKIKTFVDEFIEFAAENPRLHFLVTEIGCGIAGYTPEQIAPLFRRAIAVEEISLPHSFWYVLSDHPMLF